MSIPYPFEISDRADDVPASGLSESPRPTISFRSNHDSILDNIV